MFSRLLLTVLLLFSGLSLYGAREFDSFLGVGSLTRHVGKIQVDESGGRNSFDFHLYFEGGLSWNFHESFYFNPEFALSLPKGSDNSKVKQFFSYLRAPFGLELAKNFQVFLSPGIFFTHITGPGGTTSARNGTTTTDFFLPDGTNTASNYILGLGSKYRYQDFGLKLDFFAMNSFSTRSRTFSYSLSLHYYLGEFWHD